MNSAEAISPWFPAHAVALALFAAVLASACSNEPPAQSDTLVAATSIQALATILKPVVGSHGRIVVVLPAGSSPHAYEPRPSDMRVLADADLLFLAGVGVDEWASGLTDARVVDLLGLTPDSLRAGPFGEADPHTWLDPMVVGAALPGIVDALCEVAPEGCPGFRVNASLFSDELGALSTRLEQRMTLVRDARVVVSGPFLTYWSRRYGPVIAAVVEEHEGVEPSANRMRLTIDAARTSSGVVGQVWLPTEPARAVAEAASVPYVLVDPIGTSETARDYPTFLSAIADSMLKHLAR